MHNKYIVGFYEEVCKKLGNNYKLILEPTRNSPILWELRHKVLPSGMNGIFMI